MADAGIDAAEIHALEIPRLRVVAHHDHVVGEGARSRIAVRLGDADPDSRFLARLLALRLLPLVNRDNRLGDIELRFRGKLGRADLRRERVLRIRLRVELADGEHPVGAETSTFAELAPLHDDHVVVDAHDESLSRRELEVVVAGVAKVVRPLLQSVLPESVLAVVAAGAAVDVGEELVVPLVVDALPVGEGGVPVAAEADGVRELAQLGVAREVRHLVGEYEERLLALERKFFGVCVDVVRHLHAVLLGAWPVNPPVRSEEVVSVDLPVERLGVRHAPDTLVVAREVCADHAAAPVVGEPLLVAFEQLVVADDDDPLRPVLAEDLLVDLLVELPLPDVAAVRRVAEVDERIDVLRLEVLEGVADVVKPHCGIQVLPVAPIDHQVRIAQDAEDKVRLPALRLPARRRREKPARQSKKTERCHRIFNKLTPRQFHHAALRGNVELWNCGNMKLWKYENKLFVAISRTYAIRLFNVANVEVLPIPMLPISNLSSVAFG